jgi:hypothetical protein
MVSNLNGNAKSTTAVSDDMHLTRYPAISSALLLSTLTLVFPAIMLLQTVPDDKELTAASIDWPSQSTLQLLALLCASLSYY